MPTVTLVGAANPLDRNPSAEVEVGGKSYRFEKDRPQDVPQGVVDRLKESDLSHLSFQVDDKKGGK